MINFEKKTWYNKNDVSNEAKRIPISASQLNRIEDAISAVVSHENNMMMHWWKRSKIVDAIVETMPKITSGDYGIKSGKVNCFTDSSSTIKLYYSDSVSVKRDSNTGVQYVELNQPTTWDVSYSTHDTDVEYTLQNKYIILHFNNSNYESKTPPSHTFATTTKDGGVLLYSTSSSKTITWTESTYFNGSKDRYGLNLSSLHETQIRNFYGETEYVNSPNRDAYSEGWNETESLLYEYLGVPFENSLESIGMEFGYYYGDGQNSRLIKTSRTPAFVWFNPGASSYAITTKVFSAGSYGSYIKMTSGGFILEGSPSATNALGTKYNYVVFYQ